MSDELLDIEVIYGGRRILRDGKLADMWALNGDYPNYESFDKAAGLFKGGTRRTIGAVYKTKGKIVDGKLNTMVVKAVRYACSASLSFDIELEALDKQNVFEAETGKAEKKARDDTVLSKEIERLSQLIAKVSNYESRLALHKVIARAIENRVYEIRKHGR